MLPQPLLPTPPPEAGEDELLIVVDDLRPDIIEVPHRPPYPWDYEYYTRREKGITRSGDVGNVLYWSERIREAYLGFRRTTPYDPSTSERHLEPHWGSGLLQEWYHYSLYILGFEYVDPRLIWEYNAFVRSQEESVIRQLKYIDWKEKRMIDQWQREGRKRTYRSFVYYWNWRRRVIKSYWTRTEQREAHREYHARQLEEYRRLREEHFEGMGLWDMLTEHWALMKRPFEDEYDYALRRRQTYESWRIGNWLKEQDLGDWGD